MLQRLSIILLSLAVVGCGHSNRKGIDEIGVLEPPKTPLSNIKRPSDIDYHWMTYQVAMIRSERGQVDEAAAYVERRASQRVPKSNVEYRILGRTYLDLAKAMNKAKRDFRVVNYYTLKAIGLYRSHGSLEEIYYALFEVGSAPQESKMYRAFVLNQAALVAANIKDSAKSRELEVKARVQLSLIQMKLKNFAKAEESAIRALKVARKIDGENRVALEAASYRRMGQVYYSWYKNAPTVGSDTGTQKTFAKEAFEKAIELGRKDAVFTKSQMSRMNEQLNEVN